MIRRPRRSPLFPYTPLFRSPRLALSGQAAERARVRGVKHLHVSLTHSAGVAAAAVILEGKGRHGRSEEHTSELQSQSNLVCRLLLEKKKAHECDGDGVLGLA